MSVMPEVDIWISCDTCEVPWVLRRNLLDGKWLWMRDCKHKTATYTAMDDKGPLPKDDDGSNHRRSIDTEGER